MTTEEPNFGGDGVWPPKHDYVERMASYCCIRSIMAMPREYQDEPITEATINVLVLAAEPDAPRVFVKGRRVAKLERINVTIRVE